MKDNKQKLELTWIGKHNPEYNIANIEPRILQESLELSNCKNDANTQNKIIHGDNLLALKALLPEFEGKVKCIYIDPPYNTGNAFEHYDDAVEHSTWLSLMKPRLEIIRNLLKDDGMALIQIDNKELHYLKVLCDEVFGRSNYRNSIIVRKGVKNVQKQFDTVERLNAGFDTVIMYSKNCNLRIPNLFGKVDKKDIKGSWNNHWRGTDRPTMRYGLLGVTPEKGQFRWSKERSYKAVENYKIFLTYLGENKINSESQSAFDITYQNYLDKKLISDVKNFELVRLSKTGKPEHYIPPSEKILLSENWMDLLVAGRLTDFEHEKNELLIHRILDWLTKENDLVLDSFLGSGTTAAVAHKMKRRYIGIEMGDHAYTHCKTRLDKVIDGEQGGISKALNWQGGGAYKFYELAPSFITKDEFGNLVIDSFYNDAKLIQAMCKLMNFKYQPSQEQYWKHGVGQGKNYLFVTTQILTCALVAQISSHLGENESLIICSKNFESGAGKIDGRIAVKKIPQSVLKSCNFGKKEYLLPIKENKALEELSQNEIEEEND